MVDPGHSNAAEQALIELAVAGDRLALNELLWSHFDDLEAFIARRVALIGKEKYSTEDLLQETFVRAIRGIRGFQPCEDGAFGGWLRTIAQNVVNSAAASQSATKRGGRFRRQRTVSQPGDSSLVELVELLSDRRSHPSSLAAREEVMKAMHVGIAELPDDQRQAIHLRFIRGQNIEQVADSLGRTPAAVRGLLHRAKSQLRDALGRSSRWFNRK